MEKQTKILLGLAAAGVVAYLVFKSKKPKKSTASVHLPVEKIDEQIKKELPKEETPASPATPSSPATPATPASPSTPSTPSTPAAPVIPEIPAFDFEQYFKDHPIVFDIDPNVGSTMVVNPPAYGNTDPFAKYQNCISLEEYMDLKAKGVPMSPDVCIIGTGNPISAKDMENAFKMKDFKNELSRDQLGGLNNFMRRGTDYSYLDETPDYDYGGGNNNGGIYNKFSCDPFGFGGIPSC
jgi:hypothetical protein